MSWMIGVRMISIAMPILPPGTTRVLRRDMNEPGSIASRFGKLILNLAGSAKRITTRLSSGVGMSRAMNGLEVSTVGIRWKLISVRENCGVMWCT